MLKFIKIKFLIIYYIKEINADNGIVKGNPCFQNLNDDVTPYGDNNGLISDN